MNKVFLVVLLSVILAGCQPIKEIEDTGKGMSNLQYTAYEGRINGSTIYTAASFHSNDDISIYVRTGVNQEGFFVQTAGCYTLSEGVAVPAEGCQYVSASQIKNIGDNQHYVYNFGDFDSVLYKNAEGEVKLIIMEQRVPNN